MQANATRSGYRPVRLMIQKSTNLLNLAKIQTPVTKTPLNMAKTQINLSKTLPDFVEIPPCLAQIQIHVTKTASYMAKTLINLSKTQFACSQLVQNTDQCGLNYARSGRNSHRIDQNRKLIF